MLQSTYIGGGFILPLLEDLTKKAPNINTTNISQGRRYRDIF
jgi:hypothetical protein